MSWNGLLQTHAVGLSAATQAVFDSVTVAAHAPEFAGLAGKAQCFLDPLQFVPSSGHCASTQVQALLMDDAAVTVSDPALLFAQMQQQLLLLQTQEHGEGSSSEATCPDGSPLTFVDAVVPAVDTLNHMNERTLTWSVAVCPDTDINAASGLCAPWDVAVFPVNPDNPHHVFFGAPPAPAPPEDWVGDWPPLVFTVLGAATTPPHEVVPMGGLHASNTQLTCVPACPPGTVPEVAAAPIHDLIVRAGVVTETAGSFSVVACVPTVAADAELTVMDGVVTASDGPNTTTPADGGGSVALLLVAILLVVVAIVGIVAVRGHVDNATK